MRSLNRTIRVSLGIVFVGVVISSFVLGVARADDVEDFYIQHALQRYFDLPQNARTLGMAGSTVATSTDVSAVFGNPAGIGWHRSSEVSFSYMRSELSGDEAFFPSGAPGDRLTITGVDEDFNRWQFQGTIPLEEGQWGVLGLGASFYDSEIDDYYDTDTDGYRLHLAYGKTLGDYWSVGYSLTYINGSEDSLPVDYDMDDGLRHSIGAQLWPYEDWWVGLSLFYGTGQGDSDITTIGDLDGDLDSWGFDLGVSWQVAEQTLLAFSVDYTDYNLDVDMPVGIAIPGAPGEDDKNEDGDSWGLHIGVEHSFSEEFDGRIGYRYERNDYDFDNVGVVNMVDFSEPLSGDADMHAASLGLGFNVDEQCTIDYGFEYRWIGGGDMSHIITVSYRF